MVQSEEPPKLSVADDMAITNRMYQSTRKTQSPFPFVREIPEPV